MAVVSPEESLQWDTSILGNAYGSALHYCKHELWNVSESWDRYETLFGSNERVEILNAGSAMYPGLLPLAT